MATHYKRTQPAAQLLLVMGLATLVVIASVVLAHPSPGTSDDLRIILSLVAAILVVTTTVFSTLTVEVTEHEVRWSFTFFVRKRLSLSRIAAVTPVQTSLIDGIGIHWTRRGWLYNVSGRGAVQLQTVDGHKVLIGSPEPAVLAAAIERALRSRR